MDETKLQEIKTLYNQWVDEKPETRNVIFIATDGARNIIGLRGDTRQLKAGLACAMNSDDDLREIVRVAYIAYRMTSAMKDASAQDPETSNQE